AALARCAEALPRLRVVRQPNAGHGQACLTAYRAALDGGAGWVLQVDSDGQCDARHFGALWAARPDAPAVLGRRRRRADGLARTLISRVLAVVVCAGTGRWLSDANSPYRLMRADVLAAALPRIPPNVSLANVLLTVDLAAHTTIRWVDVGFRVRTRPATRRHRCVLMQAFGLWRDLGGYRRASAGRDGRPSTRDSWAAFRARAGPVGAASRAVIRGWARPLPASHSPAEGARRHRFALAMRT